MARMNRDQMSDHDLLIELHVRFDGLEQKQFGIAAEIAKAIDAHQNGCPHGKKMAKVAAVFTMLGALIGVAYRWLSGNGR